MPRWLSDLISKLHAKNPADRLQSAREAADFRTLAVGGNDTHRLRFYDVATGKERIPASGRKGLSRKPGKSGHQATGRVDWSGDRPFVDEYQWPGRERGCAAPAGKRCLAPVEAGTRD